MDKIPVIDFGKILSPSADEKDWSEVATQIYDACHGIGFMYIINHGIPQAKVQAVLDENEKFFSLPQSRKDEFNFEQFWGYVRAGQELLHPDSLFELRESFALDHQKIEIYTLPEELPNLRKAYTDLTNECNNLGNTLMILFGKALRLPDENHFVDSSRGLSDLSISNHSTLRSQWYPAIGQDVDLSKLIRCSEHTDYGSCTLLFQDSIGGLEVQNAQGQWVAATPLENSVLVNLGDAVEMWTGGEFKATTHRVMIPEEEKLQKKARQSIGYFIQLDSDYIIRPIKTNVYNGAIVDFEAIRASDFLLRRLAASHRTY